MQRQEASDVSGDSAAVTDGDDSACTAACTSETESGHAEELKRLADVLLGLSESERAELAAMLEERAAAD